MILFRSLTPQQATGDALALPIHLRLSDRVFPVCYAARDDKYAVFSIGLGATIWQMDGVR
jgi:hypothetical protein